MQNTVDSLTPALKRDDVCKTSLPCFNPEHMLHEVVRERWVNNQGGSLYLNCNDIIKAYNCCYSYLYPKGIDLISQLC